MRSWFQARWSAFKAWCKRPLFEGGFLGSWIDNHFVDDWEAVLKKASSIKLAAAASVIIMVILEFPALYLFILTTIVGTFWAAIVALAVGIGAIYFRLKKDKSDRKDQNNGTTQSN